MSRFSRYNKSSNPFLNDKAYQKASSEVLDSEIVQEGSAEYMTVNGAVNKTFILLGVLLAGVAFAYFAVAANPGLASILFYGGMFGGLGVIIFASFRPQLSYILAPLYAGLEGLFVAVATMMFAGAYEGIVIQAISLTLAILFLMLFLYKTGIIKVTQKFRSGVIMATGAVFLVYLASFALSFFGINIPYLHSGGMIGIGISLVIIAIASLNLLLDFDSFERGEALRAPKYMEWYSGMGLIVTLVWLYIEILRLLAILSSND